MINVQKIRDDFPILKKTIHGKPLVYLDSTATALKPQQVLDEMNGYYQEYSANIYRGMYSLSEVATDRFEHVRTIVTQFLHTDKTQEIIFIRNSTEAVNLLASSFLLPHLSKNDRVVTTVMEHHANFVPWQQACLRTGAEFEVVSITPDCTLDTDDLQSKITRTTKLFAFSATSNVLGTITPVKTIVSMVKRINPSCVVVVDAAQAAAHMPINVNEWGADAVVFSGHKVLGPTGFGVLWAKEHLLEHMMPYQYGGEMIERVTIEQSTFKHAPQKFEAGTPAIAEVIGGGRALEYLMDIGLDNVRAHEQSLVDYALNELKKIDVVTTYGPQDSGIRAGIIPFTMQGIHPHDIAQILDDDAVCIRSGHHCAQPLHDHLGISSTARASFYLYTTKSEIDVFVQGLEKVYHRLKK